MPDLKKTTIQLLHYPIQIVQLLIHRVNQMNLEKRKKIVIRALQLIIKKHHLYHGHKTNVNNPSITSAKYGDYPYITLHKYLYKRASLSVAEKFKSV